MKGMSKTEYKKKVKAAQRTGAASMPEGSKLIRHGACEWAVIDRTGQTVDTASTAETLYYLFEE